jgi:hypothetical protein
VTRSAVSRFVPASLLFLAVAHVSACSVDRDKYAQRVYTCDLREANPDRSCGQEWICYGAAQIGTYDFCAPRCDAGVSGTTYCTDSHAALQICTPQPDRNPCPPGYQCIRTNLTTDTGLCLPLDVCSSDADCVDPVRQACGGSVLAAYYAGTTVKTDGMSCLQARCGLYTPCEPGGTCLRGALFAQDVPDICVPNCGHEGSCPRGYGCGSNVFKTLGLDFCLPGLLAFPCQNDDQCTVGRCTDLGDGLHGCTVSCSSNADCEPWQGSGFDLSCGAGECVSLGTLLLPYQCEGAADLRCAQREASLSCQSIPTGAGSGTESWLCTKACTRGADCAPVDGVPWGCLMRDTSGTGTCVPGIAGAICDGDANCLEGLSCHPLGMGGYSICTTACQADADCATHRWMGMAMGVGFKCGAGKTCLPAL